MFFRKGLIFLVILLTCFSPFFAQQNSMTTVEQQYLSSVADIIIMELTNSDSRDNKLVALQYIEDALKSGRKTPEMTNALTTLAGEGTYNSAKVNGRISNNFPDVRLKASELLGEMGTPEAKDSLVEIIRVDNEPSVLAAAVRSAGKIGIVNNDDVVTAIIGAQRKLAALNPSSSLALEVINTFEAIAPKVKDKSAMIKITAEIASNYKYVTPVRNRAQELFHKLSAQN